VSAGLKVHREPLREHDAVLVRVVGHLTAGSRHILWAAVRKVLADPPRALIVDLSLARLVDPSAASVFIGLRRNASIHAPRVALMWCGAMGPLVDLMRRADRRWMYRTLADAVRAIPNGSGEDRWQFWRLEPEPGSVSAAGVLIADACVAWELPHLIYRGRRATFDLVRAAQWCPPREVHLSAFRRANEVLISVRSLIAGEHVGWCASRRRLPGGHHFKRTGVGHVGWTWLPTITQSTLDSA